jgi:hypothetical protein
VFEKRGLQCQEAFHLSRSGSETVRLAHMMMNSGQTKLELCGKAACRLGEKDEVYEEPAVSRVRRSRRQPVVARRCLMEYSTALFKLSRFQQ